MKARRLDIIDQIVEGDESVVLVANMVIRLSALATAILRELDDWSDSADVAETMTATFGPAPAGTNPLLTIESALREMAEQGLVEYV